MARILTPVQTLLFVLPFVVLCLLEASAWVSIITETSPLNLSLLKRLVQVYRLQLCVKVRCN